MLSKGNNSEFQIFGFRHYVSKDLRYYKYLMAFNEQTRNIEIYEVEKMKLYQILLFHYFDIKYFKWNQEQSSFIAVGYSSQYCVFERIC